MKKLFYLLLLTAISLHAQTTGVNKLKIVANPEKTSAERVMVQDATTGEVGFIAKSSLVTDISGKENTITVGTTSQYWRGDKTWQTLPTYTLSGLGGQPLDADLTAIGGLTGTSGFLKKTAADTWALDTNSYLTGITSGNVTTALGYTPYNSSNPAGYITGITFAGVTAKPTTLSGYGITDAQPLITAGTTSQYWRGDKTWQTLPTYTLSGLGGQPLDTDLTAIGGLTGTSGFLKKTAADTWALDTNSYLTGITSGNVTTALGYTPYNATNPNGYISGISSANVTTALGYTPYNATNPNGYITTAGRAFPKKADGSNLNFSLSGSIAASATGTTTILGTENGTDVSNYSTSSLSVGYAANAGSLSNMNISQFTNNSGYITGISSANVTTALGYTPYNSSNPAGYITSSGSISGSAGSVAWTNVSGRPTNVSSFTNDSGYITGSYLPLSGGTVSGSITATAFYASSDKRLKNIIARDGDMIQYTWKDKRDTKVHYGYVAQEVKKEMPNQVNKDDNGYLSVNYIEVLVAKVNALEKEVKRLKAKLK